MLMFIFFQHFAEERGRSKGRDREGRKKKEKGEKKRGEARVFFTIAPVRAVERVPAAEERSGQKKGGGKKEESTYARQRHAVVDLHLVWHKEGKASGTAKKKKKKREGEEKKARRAKW